LKLDQALGLGKGESAAFIGAGGKTSLIFALAKEMQSSVILTTTTHMGVWQAELADVHVVVQGSEDISPEVLSRAQSVLITGPPGDDNRLHGLGEASISKLQRLCKEKNLNLLIEADGARQLPLKAPAEYEPVIPPKVDTVVVIAGLSGIGKPLDEQWVHRPEIFSAVTGLKEKDIIRVQDLVVLLGSPKGGMKGIPAISRKILFLSQADEGIATARGGRLARDLTGHYNRVIVGCLNQADRPSAVHGVFSQTAGVILAAGGSERLRTPKQLLDWQGKPYVYQVAMHALEARLKPLIVITGAYHDQVVQALSELSVKIVHNPDWAAGQSTSVKMGLKALPKNCDSVMFLLSDQPHLPSQLMRQLIERYSQNRKPITAPMVDGQRGNPVLLNRKTFPKLAAITGDRGARAIIHQFEVDWLPWMDRRILLDVDQEGDDIKLKAAYSEYEG
jgi:molybdenum cofactor cytidylyltransferase